MVPMRKKWKEMKHPKVSKNEGEDKSFLKNIGRNKRV